MSTQVWWAEGGTSGPPVVLLHGSGATSDVWAELLRRLPPGQRWFALDLPGHGRSVELPYYSLGAVAAAVAAALVTAVGPAEPCVVVGHSLGGLVGLALSDPVFGLTVVSAICLSVKVTWSAEDLQRRTRRALAPRRTFRSREEAQQFFAKISGLAHSPVSPTGEQLAGGVVRSGSGFVLAQDPLSAGVAPLSVERVRAFATSTEARVWPVCGDSDPMTTPSAMSIFGKVEVIQGGGHDLHLTHTDDVARIVSEQLAECGSPR
jgi:pimeloyl-ACP methyl ester carboxylesterase